MRLWITLADRIPELGKYVIIAGLIAFVSFLCPHDLRFKYEFERGQDWVYEDLVAPFDFPVLRPPSERSAEEDEIEENYPPHYVLDPAVAEQGQKIFQTSFEEQLQQLEDGVRQEAIASSPGPYLEYGRRLLSGIYSKGIVQVAPEHEQSGSDFVIQLIEGNKARTETLGNVLTLEAIPTLLRDSLAQSNLRHPEFLSAPLEAALQPSVQYDDSLTQKTLQEALDGIAVYQGRVSKGELIVSNDSYINDEIYRKLISMREQYRKEVISDRTYFGVLAGYVLLCTLVIGLFVGYIRLYAPFVFSQFSNLLFVLLWLAMFSYVVYAVEFTGVISIYVVPFCIVPIVIKTFYEERLALFTHISVVFLAGFVAEQGYAFTFLQLLAGVAVLLFNVTARNWNQFFYALLLVLMVYFVGYIGLSLIKEGKLVSIEWPNLYWLAISTLLTLLAFPLIPLLERLFGFTSSISLLELSDMNRPLLRSLATEAPGTLQHSLQVANLCEEAARAIGANYLLAKVGALYHDVGKIKNPHYFIENQAGENPHLDITDKESAQLIIEHVEYGVELAKKAHLPKVIIDFIRTHHGTTCVAYFYHNYLREHPDDQNCSADFCYPGPRPRTKEEAILMLADSIEAACKSMKAPTAEGLETLIDKIVAGKITSQQLRKTSLSFRELEACKKVFKQLMKSVHHGRIVYPD